MFSNKMVKRLLASTRTILLKYYAEADIVPVLEDLEDHGIAPEKLGFKEALEEFERRGITRIASLAPWLTVKKKCSKDY
jgi:hypothetical protein